MDEDGGLTGAHDQLRRVLDLIAIARKAPDQRVLAVVDPLDDVDQLGAQLVEECHRFLSVGSCVDAFARDRNRVRSRVRLSRAVDARRSRIVPATGSPSRGGLDEDRAPTLLRATSARARESPRRVRGFPLPVARFDPPRRRRRAVCATGQHEARDPLELVGVEPGPVLVTLIDDHARSLRKLRRLIKASQAGQRRYSTLVLARVAAVDRGAPILSPRPRIARATAVARSTSAAEDDPSGAQSPWHFGHSCTISPPTSRVAIQRSQHGQRQLAARSAAGSAGARSRRRRRDRSAHRRIARACTRDRSGCRDPRQRTISEPQ